MTRLPDTLRDSLSYFIAGCDSYRNAVTDSSFDVVEFLAEAILCAERDESKGLPGLSLMLERLDKALEYHKIDSEVRQQCCRYGEDQRRDTLSDEVFAWFDAPRLGAPDGVVDPALHRALSGDNGRRW